MGDAVSPIAFAFKGGQDGFRTGFSWLRFLKRPDKWHRARSRAKVRLPVVKRSQRTTPLKGTAVTQCPQSCHPFPFSKRSRKSVFLCEISQYLNTLQAKQNTVTGFDLCFIIENACFCSVKLMNAQLRGGIWRLVLDCAPPKAADPIPNPWDTNWQTYTGWQLGSESGHTQGNKQAIPGHFARSE